MAGRHSRTVTDIAGGDRHRRVRTRAAVVEPAAIHQLSVAIEEIQVRRARGAKGLGNILRLVEQIWERVSRGRGLLPHSVRTVFGKRVDVIGIDGDKRETVGLILRGEPREAMPDVRYE